MIEASLEQNVTAARREHLVPGREIHLQNMRGRRFCEVGLVTGTNQDNAIANVWNTTGTCDPAPEQFDALDAYTIARENRVQRAWLNPVRHWMFDQLDVWEAGDDKTFGTITATWMGAAAAATMQARDQVSYDPGYTHSTFSFSYDEGSEVYLLEAPDGEVFVMQSFSPRGGPALSEDSLAQLAGRLDLPAGWGFRAEVLDHDLRVSTASHDSLAHLVQDNLYNIYQGSDVGRAFSQLRPEDGQWEALR